MQVIVNPIDKLTIPDRFAKSAEKWSSAPALSCELNGVNHSYTWSEYYQVSCKVARSLIAIGFGPREGISILASNRHEWVILQQACIMTNGVSSGIYPSNTPSQAAYVIEHSESTVVMVDSAEQLAKIKKIRSNLPKIKKIIYLDGTDEDPDIISWSDFLGMGENVPVSDLDQRLDQLKADDCCIMVYTSGTTSNPKAVMLSHDNVTWSSYITIQIQDIRVTDTYLSILPLCHIAEQMVGVYAPMTSGMHQVMCPHIELTGDYLKKVRPSVFMGVPRIWEKIKEKMEAAALEASPLKLKIARWAKGVGLRYNQNLQRCEKISIIDRILFKIADKIVFSKVKEKLGLQNQRCLVVTGASCRLDVLEYFLSLNIVLKETYGLSEVTGPATYSTNDHMQTGIAGWFPDMMPMKVSLDGEILIQGRHVFKGYYKDESATNACMMSDGWFRTGDLGEITDDGLVNITGRKKEVIITSGGMNVTPLKIEDEFGKIRCLAYTLIFGEGKKFLTALFILNEETLPEEMDKIGIEYKNLEQLLSNQVFLNFFKSKVEEANAHLNQVQKIKKYRIHDGFFSVENEALTPTMKLKKIKLLKQYQNVVEELYEAS